MIIGGTALTGGRGSVIGTLVGILLLGMIGNGLVLRNISSFYQPVVTGAILLVAIMIDEIRRRVVWWRRERRDGRPLLETRGLSKHYGMIRAVRGRRPDARVAARSSPSSATTARASPR